MNNWTPSQNYLSVIKYWNYTVRICYNDAKINFRNPIYQTGHVTSATYFANVFVIGFATGQVWLFFVKGPLEFHNLDFNQPNVTLKAGNEPIISLDLGLGLCKEETILVCSSEKDAYVYRI